MYISPKQLTEVWADMVNRYPGVTFTLTEFSPPSLDGKQTGTVTGRLEFTEQIEFSLRDALVLDAEEAVAMMRDRLNAAVNRIGEKMRGYGK